MRKAMVSSSLFVSSRCGPMIAGNLCQPGITMMPPSSKAGFRFSSKRSGTWRLARNWRFPSASVKTSGWNVQCPRRHTGLPDRKTPTRAHGKRRL